MDYKFDLKINATIVGAEVDGEESLDSALETIGKDISLALERYFEVEGQEVSVVSYKVVGQTVTAKVTNIKIYEEDLQDQIPEELTVKFYFTDSKKEFTDFTGRKFDALTLSVESATEDQLNEMPGLEGVSVTSLDYNIIETESGEPL